jgi:hypothetical protein
MIAAAKTELNTELTETLKVDIRIRQMIFGAENIMFNKL